MKFQLRMIFDASSIELFVNKIELLAHSRSYILVGQAEEYVHDSKGIELAIQLRDSLKLEYMPNEGGTHCYGSYRAGVSGYYCLEVQDADSCMRSVKQVIAIVLTYTGKSGESSEWKRGCAKIIAVVSDAEEKHAEQPERLVSAVRMKAAARTERAVRPRAIVSDASNAADTLGELCISYTITYRELKMGPEIGAGGFGVVCRGAYQGAVVAIKQLRMTRMSEETKEEFQREAEIMIRLRHPNIVQLYGICTEPGHYCMVMQYMTNGSLYNFLHSSHSLGWAQRWNIALDIGRGISHLHSQHILHRDLKSPNVLLEERDGELHAKITDFGLAKVKTETRTSTYASPMGTLPWMAPEILGLMARYSPASDVYAYAIILWEIVTRKSPYAEAADAQVIIRCVQAGEREAIPPECPSRYAALIERCWAQRPEARPSIEVAIRELEASRPAI